MSTALAHNYDQAPIALSNETLDAYMAQVSAIPVISTEQEQFLAKKLTDDADLDSARQLVISHLRFVAHIARGYSGYGLPLSDLILDSS